MSIDNVKNRFSKNILKNLIFIDVDKSIFPCFAEVKGVTIPIPLLYSNLVDKIKKGNSYESVPTNDIIEGIGILLGCDTNFKYKNEYLNILKVLNSNPENTLWHLGLTYMNNSSFETAFIIFDFLVHNFENIGANSFKFNQALCMYNLAISSKNDVIQQDFITYGIELFESVQNDENIIKNDYLGILYKMHKDYQKAYDNFKIFIETFNPEKDNEWFKYISDECNALYQVNQFEYGVFNFENYKHQKALTYFLPLEQNNPNWFALVFLIGKCYRALEDPKSALEYYMRAFALEKNSADLNNEIGLSYYMLGEIGKAKSYILKANELEKENVIFMTNLCSIYLELNDISSANDIISHALKISPKDEVAIKCQELIQKRIKENNNGR